MADAVGETFCIFRQPLIKTLCMSRDQIIRCHLKAVRRRGGEVYKASKSSFAYFYLRWSGGVSAGTKLCLASKLHDFNTQGKICKSFNTSSLASPVSAAWEVRLRSVSSGGVPSKAPDLQDLCDKWMKLLPGSGYANMICDAAQVQSHGLPGLEVTSGRRRDAAV